MEKGRSKRTLEFQFLERREMLAAMSRIEPGLFCVPRNGGPENVEQAEPLGSEAAFGGEMDIALAEPVAMQAEKPGNAHNKQPAKAAWEKVFVPLVDKLTDEKLVRNDHTRRALGRLIEIVKEQTGQSLSAKLLKSIADGMIKGVGAVSGSSAVKTFGDLLSIALAESLSSEGESEAMKIAIDRVVGALSGRFFDEEILQKPIEEVTPDVINDAIKSAPTNKDLYKMDFPAGWLSSGDPSYKAFVWRLPNGQGYRAQFIYKFKYAGVEYVARIDVHWMYPGKGNTPEITVEAPDVQPIPPTPK